MQQICILQEGKEKVARTATDTDNLLTHPTQLLHRFVILALRVQLFLPDTFEKEEMLLRA